MTVLEARLFAQRFLASPAELAQSGELDAFARRHGLTLPARHASVARGGPHPESAYVSSPSPRLDGEVLLASILGTTRAVLAAHPELEIGAGAGPFLEGLSRRATGLALAYITGTKEFWGIDFKVTPDVLIPKPDTETLVERALALIDTRAWGGTSGEGIRVLDVCTGSGCVAVSVKRSRPLVRMTATDVSAPALAVARENARGLAVAFVEGDLRSGLPAGDPKGYHLVVSNPPYVPSAVVGGLLADGRGDPSLALDGGADGLDLVRSLVENVREVLLPGGALLVETGEYNAREAAEYLRKRGFADVVVHRDLGNKDRVVEGTLP